MLIAFEGIDGAGKRTQMLLLKERAENEGFSVGTVSFPRYGKTLLSGAVADYLNGKFGDVTDIPAQFPALLYAMDRFESRDLLSELQRNNDLVVADRYVASNLAYQACKLPVQERAAFIDWLSEVEYGVFGLPQADITLYLDVPVSVSFNLVAKKGRRSYTESDRDLHERNRELLTACRAVYQSLCASWRDSHWVQIDCVTASGQLGSRQAVGAAVWDALQGHLPPK